MQQKLNPHSYNLSMATTFTEEVFERANTTREGGRIINYILSSNIDVIK